MKPAKALKRDAVKIRRALELERYAIKMKIYSQARMQLVEKLLRSLNPTQKEIDKLWAKEAERRIEEIKSCKVKTIPGEKVFKWKFCRQQSLMRLQF